MAGDRQVKIEILGDAKSAQAAFKAAGDAGGGFGSLIGGIGKGLAVFDLAAAGLGRITGALGGFIGDAMESQRIGAQTQAVIESTGGAAGVSAQQVGDLATSLSKVTPIDDEVIQSAENMLLTFTNIGADVFPTATKAALDMATALGSDPTQAAQMLGKALQDPVAGVTALQRVGVRLTDQQKEQVKAMVAVGDVAGAQGVILNELSKEFGGSAEAAGKTFAGQLAIAKTQIGNLKEAIGGALLPVLTRLLPVVTSLAGWLGDRLPAVFAIVGGWVTRLSASLRGPLLAAFVFVRDALLTFIQALQGNWTDDSRIQPLHRAIGLIGTVIRDQVIPFVTQMADFFQTRVIPAFQQVMGVVQQVAAAFGGGGGLAGVVTRLSEVLGPVAQQLLAWAGQVLVMLVDSVGKWAGALIDWIAPQIPPLLAALGQIVLAIGQWALNTALPAIAAQLAVWGQALIDWIGPRIGPVLAALGDLLTQIGAWAVNTGLPTLAAALLAWGQALIDWVGPQIPPLLAALGDLLKQVGAWLLDPALPTIVSNLAQWGQQFIAWIAPQIPPLLVELGKLLLSLGDWLLTTALPEIISKLAQWGAEFVAWVAPQIPPLLEALGGLLVSLGDWMLTTALPEIVTKLAQWGLAFLDWIATDVLPELPGKLLDILNAITGWIADQAYVLGNKLLTEWVPKFLGFVADVISGLPEKLGGVLGAIGQWIIDNGPDIASTAAGIGADVLSGIASGLTDFIGSGLDAALQAIVDHIPGPLKKLLDIGSPSKLMRDEVGLPIPQGIAAGILKGLPLIDDAVGQIYGHIGDMLLPFGPDGGGTKGGRPIRIPGPGTVGGRPPRDDRPARDPSQPGPSGGGDANPASGSTAAQTAIQVADAQLDRARLELQVANQRLDAAQATHDARRIAQAQYDQQQAILAYQAALAAYQAAVDAARASHENTDAVGDNSDVTDDNTDAVDDNTKATKTLAEKLDGLGAPQYVNTTPLGNTGSQRGNLAPAGAQPGDSVYLGTTGGVARYATVHALSDLFTAGQLTSAVGSARQPGIGDVARPGGAPTSAMGPAAVGNMSTASMNELGRIIGDHVRRAMRDALTGAI